MKLLRGLPIGDVMGETLGMRCTRDSYLVFNALLSSCKYLTNCEVNPKPARITTNSQRPAIIGGKLMTIIMMTRHDAQMQRRNGERRTVRETYVLHEI